MPHKLAEMDPLPEDWWALDEVQQQLIEVLEDLECPHPGAAAAVPDGILRDGHVHGLVRALDELVGPKKLFPHVSRATALHAWLCAHS